MKLIEYITKEIPTLSLLDKIEKAQNTCRNFPVSHVFIVDNKQLIGCFSESDIQIAEENNTKLSEYQDLFDHFFTDENPSIIGLLKTFADYSTNIIPVLDKNRNYLGYFDLTDILELLATSPFLHIDGFSITIEKLEKEYSMSEIAQIIESNEGKILGMYISNRNGDKIQITIKIASELINEIVQTFRRYDYNVLSKFEDDSYLEELQNRSDYLQKYLNM